MAERRSRCQFWQGVLALLVVAVDDGGGAISVGAISPTCPRRLLPRGRGVFRVRTEGFGIFFNSNSYLFIAWGAVWRCREGSAEVLGRPMQTRRLDIKNVKTIIFILAQRGRVCQKNAAFTAIGIIISVQQYISKMYGPYEIDDTKMSENAVCADKVIKINMLKNGLGFATLGWGRGEPDPDRRAAVKRHGNL